MQNAATTRRDPDRSQQWMSLVLSALGPILAGLLATYVVASYGDELNMRRAVILTGGLIGAFVVIRAGVVKEALLFAWVMAIPYPRTYFFGGIEHGSHGPYLITADLPLLALCAMWWWEAAVLKIKQTPIARRWWPWFLPFLVVCVLSTVEAPRPDWARFELIRILRFGLILFYARYNFRAHQLLVCAAGVACSVVAESSIGLLQIATKRFGAKVLDGEEFVRATGFTLHPNVLGSYLLLVTPVLIALFFVVRDRYLSLLFGAAAVIGTIGLIATLSRAAWALCLAELAIMGLVLMFLRYIGPQHLIFAAAAGILLAGIAAFPVRDKIMRRIQGNLRDSFDTRAELNDVARKVWDRNRLLGAGLNNLEVVIRQVAPRWHTEPPPEMERNIRARIIVIHNLWLLVAAETGLLGLCTFIWLLLGTFWRSIVVASGPSRESRIVGIGLALGLIALASQQSLESTLWVDGVFVHLAVIAGCIAASGLALREWFPVEPAPAAPPRPFSQFTNSEVAI